MYDVIKAIVRNKFVCLLFSLTVEIKTLMPFELGSVMDEWINPLLRNVVNGQIHFTNLAANAARFLKYVWPF